MCWCADPRQESGRFWTWWVVLQAVTATSLVGSAIAGTLRVPSEYATLNAAMDASSPGDTVLVGPGVYSDFETRLVDGGWGFLSWVASCCFFADGIVLRSEAGAEATTIDMLGQFGGTGAWVVLIGGKPSATMKVDGFTITGAPFGFPSVRLESNGKVILENCVFRDNPGSSFGSAVDSGETHLEVRSCVFVNNRGGPTLNHGFDQFFAEDCQFHGNEGGAALSIYGSSDPLIATVRRCSFVENEAPSACAIGANDWMWLNVEDCRFEENTTTDYPGAVLIDGVAGGSTRTRVVGNLFLNNRATGESPGAGIFVRRGGGFLENNTFYGNTREGSPSTPVTGVAVYSDQDPGFVLTIRGNIFAGNSGGFAVGNSRGVHSPTEPVSDCNVFWDNGGLDYVGFVPGPNDLFLDPGFCNPEAEEFTVSSGSICVPTANRCGIQIGAFGVGCGTVSIEPESWGRIKSRYRGGSLILIPPGGTK